MTKRTRKEYKREIKKLKRENAAMREMLADMYARRYGYTSKPIEPFFWSQTTYRPIGEDDGK